MTTKLTPCQPAQNQNPIDRYVLGRIRFRAERMVKKFKLPAHDVEDLSQDMTVEILKAAPGFDPAKSKWRTYVNSVLNKFYQRKVRDNMRKRKNQIEQAVSLTNLNVTQLNLFDPHDDIAQAEMKMDINSAISTLPKPLAEICELLKTRSKSETAEILDVSESYISYAVKKIRGHLEKNIFSIS